MAATRLGSLAQVYKARRNQTRKRMPTRSLASPAYVCLPVCVGLCECMHVSVKRLLYFIFQHLSACSVAFEVHSCPLEPQMYGN